jgi:hypothetical protein
MECKLMSNNINFLKEFGIFKKELYEGLNLENSYIEDKHFTLNQLIFNEKSDSL